MFYYIVPMRGLRYMVNEDAMSTSPLYCIPKEKQVRKKTSKTKEII